MDLSILFWFYKEKEICRNRLEQISRYNRDIKIYGLYGGLKSDFSEYEKMTGDFFDDLYNTQIEYDSHWKWLNGDLLIVDWYIKRGKFLKWDSLVIVQWDMLVFDNFITMFSDMNKDEIFITYYRKLTYDIENIWSWTQPGSKYRSEYLNFKSHVRTEYGYEGDLWCCGFILEIFPRSFLENYSLIKDKEIGFSEYKIPTYANMWGYRFFEKYVGEWYDGDKSESAINAWGIEISEEYINKQLSNPDGFRLFHPYYKIWE